MTIDINVAELGLTGYDTEDRYFASKYQLGNRQVYSVDLSLAAVAVTLPRPDPDNPAPGNRRVDLSHARGFAVYVREHEDWVSPGLLLRAPEGTFAFEVKAEVGGSQFGVLSVPRLARADLRILDGQHRILGVHIAVDDIADELAQERQLLAAAEHDDEPAGVVRGHQARIDRLLRQRDRFARERISALIVLENEERLYMQMFVDIAENAKGITKTIQARFDSRKVVNRALAAVIAHPLLDGRVEDQLDRVKTDQQLLAAKHVAEIIRGVAVGVGGRVSRRQEEELDERELVLRTMEFFDILVAAFPDLRRVADRAMTPGQLRRISLLGSATMLRVLAGVEHNLRSPRQRNGRPAALEPDQIRAFFATLAPYMAVPVTSQLWLDTGVFQEGASAPTARGGDIRRLADQVTAWGRQGRPPKPATMPQDEAGGGSGQR